MNQTPNYQLNQWERTDRVLMEDFNADNAKIDAALKAEADARAAKDAALQTAVNAKATTSALTALQTVVNGKGNCQVVTGQYTGTGTFGKDNPTTFTFDKPVILFAIATPFGIVFTAPNCSYAYLLCKGSSTAYSVTWTGQKSVVFCSTTDPDSQFNSTYHTYVYFALMAA